MVDWLDPKIPTVSRLLHDAGYATAHFGKWHLGNVPGAPIPNEYGFDETKTTTSSGPGWGPEGVTFRAKSSAAIVDESIRFITEHKGGPFYVNAWMLVPHAPLNPTDEQMAPYAAFQPEKNIQHKSAAQIYFGSVTDMDQQIGRLFKALDDLGLSENTLVLFSSDNGPEDIHIKGAGHSGVGTTGPFRGRKRSLYDGGVRMPGIIRWPGKVPAGKINDTSVVSGIDWLPSICKLVGIPLPKNDKIDGEDMSDVFLGASRNRTTPLMWERRFRSMGEAVQQSPMLAIREGDWKLMMNPDRSRIELYDLGVQAECKDLMEFDNQAEKHPDIVNRLSQRLIAWRRELPLGPVEPGAGEILFPWPGARQYTGTNIFYISYPGVKNQNITAYDDLIKRQRSAEGKY